MTRARAPRPDDGLVDPREYWGLVAVFAIVLGREAATAKEAGEKFRERAAAGDFEAWTWLQAFLSATGTASRLLWFSGSDDRGPNRLTKPWAQRIRASLNELVARRAPDLGVLRSRALRDHFEHIDERIEMWWTTTGGSFVDGVLARADGSSTTFIAKHDSPQTLRSVMIDDLTVFLRGQAYDVRPLLTVITAIAAVGDAVVHDALTMVGAGGSVADVLESVPSSFGSATEPSDSNADSNSGGQRRSGKPRKQARRA